jgi:hypothetical protein
VMTSAYVTTCDELKIVTKLIVFWQTRPRS